MKPFGTTKRNGTATVKASSRKFDVNAALAAERPIIETYKLREGEYFAKLTMNGNYFITDFKFEGYVTPNGEILRETENEIEYVQEFETEWEVLCFNPQYPDITFKICDFGGCAGGTLAFVRKHQHLFNNKLFKFIINRLVDYPSGETGWAMDLPYFISEKKVTLPAHPEIVKYLP
jgi:hypothetical protein